jgi:hypothetical protein
VVPESELKKYFEPVSGRDSCQSMSDVLTVLLCRPLTITGENENSFHGRIDQCISDFLAEFVLEFLWFGNPPFAGVI